MQDDDYTIQYEGFKLACDPKSLLYVFGMGLDYRWGTWGLKHFAA